MDILPPQRTAVLAFFRDWVEGQGHAPSLAEIPAIEGRYRGLARQG